MPSDNNLTRFRKRPGGQWPESPILMGYQASQNCTKGVVLSIEDTGTANFDRCTVNFRGQILTATCCHPSITVGMSVSMIEQPRGRWWASVLQNSWYSRPLSELADKGHPYQAALEYLLSKGPRWRPDLILIDKRGVLGSRTATIYSTVASLFPFVIFAIQTIAGVDYPCNDPDDNPDLQPLAPGCVGAGFRPLTFDYEPSYMTLSADEGGYLKKLVLVLIWPASTYWSIAFGSGGADQIEWTTESGYPVYRYDFLP